MNISHDHTQRGDAHVATTVILVVIIIGLLGVVAWQQFSKKSETENTTKDTSTTQTTSKEFSSDSSYVKSFSYPSSWKTIDADVNVCETYQYCYGATPLVVDGDNKVRVAVETPQSQPSNTIDEEAAQIAAEEGTIDQNLKQVDNNDARKVTYSNGKVAVIILTLKGYLHVSLPEATSNADTDLVLSTLKLN